MEKKTPRKETNKRDNKKMVKLQLLLPLSHILYKQLTGFYLFNTKGRGGEEKKDYSIFDIFYFLTKIPRELETEENTKQQSQ